MKTFSVNLEKTIGRIKPLHGINNGPVSYGNLTSTVDDYRDAGIPIVRLHDPDWPNPYQVDIPKIFPDFRADPEDPSAYRFSQTDDLIAAIYECGAEPLYRLGVSIEHYRETIYAVKPEDFDKWADVCVHVIRHYNEGWCNGFHYNIRFWEIWNEADGGANMWTGGTAQDYYELYGTASKRIREACPGVLVGGYAGCTVRNEAFMTGFFEYIQANHCPLDFFSWHLYTGSPERMAEDAGIAREYLRRYGYPDALSICDEWNYIEGGSDWECMRKEASHERRKAMFERMRNREGSAHAAACMIAMQNSEMDMACYYDGQPHMLFCGLFDLYAMRMKTYYAFMAFNALYERGNQLSVEGEPENGLYALAAGDSAQSCVLVVNRKAAEDEVGIAVESLGEKKHWTAEIIDETRDLEKTAEGDIGEDGRITVHLEPFAVCLIRLA